MLTQAFALIAAPEGSTIYHILIFFALQAAFFIALNHRRRAGLAEPALSAPVAQAQVSAVEGSTRLAIAAGLACAAHGLLFFLGPLSQKNGLISAAILPPLDRAASLAALWLVSWAIVFRPGKRWADLLAGAGGVVIIITAIILTVLWYPLGAQGSFYNYTNDEWIWEIAKLSVVLLSLIELVIFRPPDWGTGFGLFLILLAGIAYHIAAGIAYHIAAGLLPQLGYPVQGDYSPAERIAEMAAFLLFTILVYRHALNALPLAPALEPPAPALAVQAPARVALTPQAASALAYIAVGGSENDFSRRVTEAVGRTLLADYTLLLAPPTSGDTLTCASVFDLIREQHLPGFSISTRKVSAIASAINRGRPARLRPDTHQAELTHLADALGLPQAGPSILVPFADVAEADSGQNLGGIIVLSAFTQKDWTNDDHNLLASIAKPLAKAFASFEVKNRATAKLLAELDQAARSADAAQAETRAAHERALRLALELEDAREEAKRQQQQLESLTAVIRAETAPGAKGPGDYEALQARYRRSLEELAGLNEQLAQTQAAFDQLRRDADAAETTHVDTIAALNAQLAAKQAALEQLRRGAETTHAETLTTLQTDRDRVYLELADARAEIEQFNAEVPALTQQLAAARAEIVSLRSQLQAAPVDAPAMLRSQSETLLSLIQDLRQPLASIGGYADLLLGESVGIISPLQGSFLERVKAGAERMNNTLNDLIGMTVIDSGALTLQEQNVEVAAVIEDAFTSVGAQFREKGLSLRLDLADDLPAVAADRDALLQIISRLLTNACVASAPNTEVILTARPQPEGLLYLSITDTGGGISEKDLSRVFTRLYRADRPLIQGLGDTGVGLSLAKTLAEAQGGRLWVESQTGVGSTFSVILPANSHH